MTGIVRFSMIFVLLSWSITSSAQVGGQLPAKPPALADTSGEGHPDTITGDRFPQQRAEADRLKSLFDPIHEASVVEIPKLLSTNRCQIKRVSGLLDRTQDAMDAWIVAEKLYWKSWGDAEQSRVILEQKSIANIEAEQSRTGELVEIEKQAREDLQSRKAKLQQGTPTDAIRASIDELVKDIQDSEARLNTARQTYEQLGEKLNNFRTTLTVQLTDIRQHQSRLEAVRLATVAAYEKMRTDAQKICNEKAPVKSPTPPKGNQP